jgi:uncharacterized flavoprotein (TIGR03862 family)
MAADELARAGLQVHCFDAMPSAGRKFLLAGRGGLNLTHSEPLQTFATRFGSRQAAVAPWLDTFGPQAVRDWAHGLGVETFVGTSGRVFPREMKAAPLLRSWLRGLRNDEGGRTPVQFHMRHRWTGWDDAGALRFDGPVGVMTARPAVTVLALGGASWPRLGSDGAWAPLLQARGVDVAPLLPANCGFDMRGGWTPFFSGKFAGQPFKTVALSLQLPDGSTWTRRGEFVATAGGIEGSLVYAASAMLRDQIVSAGQAHLSIDLLPDLTAERVRAEVMHPRGSRSLASHLKGRLGLDGIKSALLHEVLGRDGMADGARLAATIKAVPLELSAARPVEEAISTAGGVTFAAVDAGLMLRRLPGVFCVGEMLDWEAPTGGYLLTACLASGVIAGRAAAVFATGR